MLTVQYGIVKLVKDTALKVIKLENKYDKKLIYTLVGLFQLAGAGSKRELCQIAEEVTGEKFSEDLLNETINKINVELSLGDKIELAKIIQGFIDNLKSMKRKKQISPVMNQQK